MEVTHLEHQDTHAVIGGSKVRAFGISDNAEFITMLSEGLYSHKKMAVIREIVCNAHDAHVVAGKLDVPIKINLTTEKLTITDFGPGIHDDVITPIYCVYGNSTKTHNGEENGGFGLGSKAPFAYTTHFTVVSQHAGTKTIYAVSRGSVETDGKPDMRVMAAVPSDKTGLEVSLPLQTPDDAEEFEELIRQVVYFGEMTVELNGEKLETLPFSNLKEKFMVLNRSANDILSQYSFGQKIYVRYGTVIYPVESIPEYGSFYEEVSAISDAGGYNSRIVILQAKPNTIAVTPSRESLSMSERTKQTIRGLLEQVSDSLKGKSLAAYRRVVDMYAEGYETVESLRNLFMQDHFNSNALFVQPFLQQPIETSLDAVMMMMISRDAHNRNAKIHIKPDIRRRVVFSALSCVNPSNKIYYRALKNIGGEYGFNVTKPDYIEAWNRITISRLQRVLGTDMQYLRVKIPGTKRGYSPRIKMLDDITDDMWRDNFFDHEQLPIGYNQKAIGEELHDEDAYSSDQPLPYCFVLMCRRKKGLAEALVEKVEDSDEFTIVDCLTEPVKRVAPAQPKPKGYVKLAAVTGDMGQLLGTSLSSLDLPRIEHPKEVIYTRTKDYRAIPNDFEKKDMNDLLVLFPDVAIVSSSRTHDNLVSKGAKSAKTALMERLVHIMKTDPDFLFLAGEAKRKQQGILGTLIKIADHDPVIHEYLDRDQPVSKETQAAVNLFMAFNQRSYDEDTRTRRVLHRIEEQVNKVKDADVTSKMIRLNSLLPVLNLDQIYRSILAKKPEAEEQLSLLHLAIEEG